MNRGRVSFSSSASIPTLGGYTSAGLSFRQLWPLHPLAPAVVLFVSLVVASAIGFAGVDHLARESDALADERAEVLASALAARIAPLTPPARVEAIQLAARRTGAEFLIMRVQREAHAPRPPTENSEIVGDASLGAPNAAALRKVVMAKRGEATTGLGRTRFALASVGPEADAEVFVIAFVRAPLHSEAAPALVTALVALMTLLIGLATTFAYAVARDANVDVEFLGKRVRAMIKVRTEPAGETVPVRAMDEVGVLTESFNQLVARFVEAERTYRANLERARVADRDRAAFLAAVSHELRSPLNAILGFADILVEEVDGPVPEEVREEVEQIRQSGAHLLELINDILEFSALESGQLRLSRASLDLVGLSGEVLREAAGLLQNRPVAVRMEGVQKLMIDADPKRVRQVLTNLVANAVKFTQRGEVVVSVVPQGAYAKLTVRDTGPGISEAERAHIFEEYRQTEDESRKKRGTGLGLAIARRLVLMHGGAIQVESELGRGSAFNVLLPFSKDRSSSFSISRVRGP
jgi:signal transduction histidine kinase